MNTIGIRQFTLADGLRLVKERLDSREWWLLAVANLEAFMFLSRIEERFYSGEDNRWFHIVNVIWPTPEAPVLALATAAKSCMTATELAAASGFPAPHDDLLVHPSTPPTVVSWLARHLRSQ